MNGNEKPGNQPLVMNSNSRRRSVPFPLQLHPCLWSLAVSPSRRCCRQPAHATAARTWPLPSPPGRRGGAEGGGPSHLIHADSAACLHDTNRWWAGWTAGVPPPTVRLTPLGPLHCCCEPHSAGTTGSRPAGGSIV